MMCTLYKSGFVLSKKNKLSDLLVFVSRKERDKEEYEI